MLICDVSKCTGCCVCMNICAKDAIVFKDDGTGRKIAEINESKCIECGACKRICPANNDSIYNEPKKCYAAWSKNTDYQKTSASGGISAGFADYIINNNGAVFGTRFDGTDLIFDMAYKPNMIKKFSGSKYVQAFAGDVYTRVKKELNNKKRVLFVGTPCQVEALNNYLNNDYDNLITVDLICHGVPPITYLKEHVKSITNEPVNNITFRGVDDYYLTLYSDNKKVYSKKSQLDTYYTAFSDGLIMRDNCYECKYACINRVSDITIGDFWGIDKVKANIKYNGRISVVLVNTDKGERFFNEVRDNFETTERPLKEALRRNGQLQHPISIHSERAIFIENYKKYGFEKAVRTKSILETAKKYKKQQFVLKIKRFLKGYIK